MMRLLRLGVEDGQEGVARGQKRPVLEPMEYVCMQYLNRKPLMSLILGANLFLHIFIPGTGWMYPRRIFDRGYVC